MSDIEELVARRDEHEALVKACADMIAGMQINRTGTIDDQARAVIAACGVEELRAEVERLKALVNERYFERSLSPADLKAAEKHCDWPAFQHAWNAVMNARTASREALTKIATTEPWQRCPSTHCERSQECRSPSECSGTGKGIARAALTKGGPR